jgi:hypothetical protein
MSTGRHGRALAAPPAPMIASPRPRHQVPAPMLALLRPLFRYSEFRDAYVLRGVGQTRGPVLRASRGRR